MEKKIEGRSKSVRIDLPFFKSRQTPVFKNNTYIDNPPVSLRVQVIKIPIAGKTDPVTGATVQIHDTAGNLIKQSSLDNNGKATFQLPEGRYNVSMRPGYKGQKQVKLKTNKKVKLEVLPVLQ